MSAITALPPIIRILGYGGLIPFVVLAILVQVAPTPFDFISAESLAAYGAVICSFLGAIHWGANYRHLGNAADSAHLAETGDIEVAKKLVVANLRLVVKIAMEYRNAWQNLMDLIQEGNIGLMKAVSKYDPTKGAKLSYYASWWIRSYILKYILDNFRLIKIGTTADQKRLFYNLVKEKERLMALGVEPGVKLLSENLGGSEKLVEEMDLRLSGQGQEISLDTPVDASRGSSVLGDLIKDQGSSPEEILEEGQSLEILQEHLADFIKNLKPRDQEIFKKRLLSEIPASLQDIANDYGVSRERIRQIEERLIGQLKIYMSEHLR
jgi:RNA polymerase sigma-32 factor